MILADTHTHSSFSTDSEATPEAMIQEAFLKGMNYLTLTDHMDYDYPGSDEEKHLFEFNVSDYFSTLIPLRNSYNDKLTLGIGIELGLRPGRNDLNRRMHTLLSEHSFDFVLGSVHLLDDEDPYYEAYWQGRSVKDILTKYFNDILTAVKEYNNFDSLGHLDYLIRYIPPSCGGKDYVYKEYSEVIDEILRLLISNGKALEINTAGLMKGLSCFHPKLEVCKRYLELGGELLTIGSDGHSPDKIATGFTVTEAMLQSIGVKGYYVYQHRIPTFIPFDLKQ